MSGAAFLNLVTIAALAMLGVTLLLAAIRMLAGPRSADRLMGLWMAILAVTGSAAVLAARRDGGVSLDAAVALALLAPAMVLVLGRWVFHSRGDDPGGEGER